MSADDDREATRSRDTPNARPAEHRTRVPLGTKVGGKYVLRRVLGSGGYARVYEAEHVEIGRRVAIKIVHSNVVDQADILARFRLEAQICGRIRDKHVPEVYDVGDMPDGAPYIVMELLEGRSLDDLLSNGALPLPHVVDLGCQLLRACAAAHAAGYVHRDIKPSNIMMHRDRGGEVVLKLLDFGISKAILPGMAERSLTLEGMIVGSPDYMSPEAMRGGDVDIRTDIYSTGVVLYEAITGEPPFLGEGLSDLMASILRDPVIVPSKIRLDCPPELERIALKAMSRKRDDRYTSPAEMEIELEAFRIDAGFEGQAGWELDLRPSIRTSTVPTAQIGRPRSIAPPGVRPVLPRWAWLAAGAVALVTAGALGATWMASGPRAGPAAAPPDGEQQAVSSPQPPPSNPDVHVATTPQTAEPPVELDEGGETDPGPDGTAATEAHPRQHPDDRRHHSRGESGRSGAEAPQEAQPATTAPEDTEPEAAADTATGPETAGEPEEGEPGATDPSGSPTAEAAEAPPEGASASELTTLATAAFVRGHLPQAMTLYRQAVARSPGYAPAWRGLGLAASRMGQRNEAVEAFRRYLELRPDARDAEQIRERLRALGAAP